MADELFRTAPREVVDYVDRRGVRATWRWTDMAPHEHALAFTVARTAGYNVIDDLRTATRKAQLERVPFETFAAELTPVLQAKGWWGRVQHDGEEVQLGSLRRLRTIYWSNVRSAHAAGEWARTQATKGVLPFLRYKVSLAVEKRAEHLGWVGITLPVDHRWWRTHYPPNGWHCQCRVEQIGEVAAGRVPPDKRRAPPLDVKLWRDAKSGVVWRVPAGIDPGWQRNPGVTRETVAAALYREKLSLLSHTARSTAIADHRGGPVFRRIVLDEAHIGWPLPRGADRTPELAAAARMMTPVASMPASLPAGLPAGVLQVSAEDAAKLQHKRPTPIGAYDLVQRMLEDTDATIIQDIDGKWQLACLIDGRPWLAVIKRTSQGEILLNSLRPLNPKQFIVLRDKART